MINVIAIIKIYTFSRSTSESKMLSSSLKKQQQQQQQQRTHRKKNRQTDKNKQTNKQTENIKKNKVLPYCYSGNPKGKKVFYMEIKYVWRGQVRPLLF